MKKIIIISFLLVFLGTNTELHQLLKLPALIHHFFEHRNQGNHESFVDFLNDHYTDTPKHANNEHHDHHNLPFKTNDCATMHNSIAYAHQNHISVCQPIIFSDVISVTNKVMFSSSAFLSSIWQPPKTS